MAALYTPGQDPSRAYYGTDTRAHTLLVGAALAVVMVHFPALVRRLSPLVPWAAVAGLVGLAALFHTVEGRGPTLYRGGFAVVAVISAAVVAGVAFPDARGPVRWLLARRPAVAVGRISYGLYLWHWPLYLWLTPETTGLHATRLTAPAIRRVVRGGRPVLRGDRAADPAPRPGGAGGAGAPCRGPGAQPRVDHRASLAVAVVATVVVSTAGAGVRDPLASATPATSPQGRDRITTTVVEPDHLLPAVAGDRPLRVVVPGTPSPGRSATRSSRRTCCPTTFACGSWPTSGAPSRRAGGGRRDRVPAPAVRRLARVRPVGPPSTSSPTWCCRCGGAWEVYDHVVDGTLLRSGTPEFAAAYQQALADNIDETVAVAPDVRFALVTVPCMEERSPWLGGAESPRNDPANLAWVNALTAEVAAGYGDRATVIDLGPLLCPDGEIVTRPMGCSCAPTACTSRRVRRGRVGSRRPGAPPVAGGARSLGPRRRARRLTPRGKWGRRPRSR